MSNRFPQTLRSGPHLSRNGFPYSLNALTVEEFPVAKYGAIPGQPDSVPGVQAAVAAAQASVNPGIKLVTFQSRSTPYNFVTTTTDGSACWHIAITGDNVWIDLRGATINTTQSTANLAVFMFNAAGRMGGAGAMDYPNWCTANTQYPISPALKGDQTVTLQTHGNASNFTVGQWLLARAGQTITAASGVDAQPDCALNQVTSTNASTGVIGLRWPLPQDLQVEYYLTGSSGQTSTVNSGNPAVQPAIANVNAKIGVNSRLRGPGTIDAPSSTWWALFLHYFDSHVDNIVGGRWSQGAVLHQFCRRFSQRHIRGQNVGSAFGTLCGAATGGTDGVVEDIRSDGTEALVHLHEGCAQVLVKDFAIIMTINPGGTRGQGLSIRGRSHDCIVRDGIIFGGNPNASVTIDSTNTDGGLVANVLAYPPSAALYGFQVNAPNWTITNSKSVGKPTQIDPGSKWHDATSILTRDLTGRLAGTDLPQSLQQYFTWAAVFPGIAGNYFTTPDAAANSITGDLEIRVVLSPGFNTRPPVAQEALVGKWGAPGQQSYLLVVQPSGLPVLNWTANGTTGLAANPGSNLATSITSDTWLRVQLRVNDGGGNHVTTFATSSDGVTWSTFGAPSTVAGTTSVFDSTTDLEIGGTTTGSLYSVIGPLARAELANSLGGSSVVQWLPPDATSSSWVAATGETWTKVGSIGYTFAGTLAKSLLTAADKARSMTVAPTYSASITPDASAGTWQRITVTNGSAFTINAPTNVPSSSFSQELVIEVLNSSGGAMGAITWNGAFLFPGITWANPASTKKRFVRFEYNGTNWVATAFSGADY